MTTPKRRVKGERLNRVESVDLEKLYSRTLVQTAIYLLEVARIAEAKRQRVEMIDEGDGIEFLFYDQVEE